MSFFPKFVYSYLLLGCLFNIALGIALMVAGSKINNINSKLVPSDQSEIKDKAAIGFYAIGGVTIFTGLLGIYGFYKNQKCVQSIFIILNIIYFIIFGAIFGFSVVFKQSIDDNLSESNCSTGYLKDADATFRKLKEVWCRVNPSGYGQNDYGCGCIIPDVSDWSEEDQIQLAGYGNIQADGSQGATKTIYECQFFEEIASGNQNAIDILKTVEDMFECTGVCEGDIIYYFNDVSKSHPSSSKGCFMEIADRVQEYIKIFKAISITIAVVCFLNFMLAFIFCCVGGKKDQKTKQNQISHFEENNVITVQ